MSLNLKKLVKIANTRSKGKVVVQNNVKPGKSRRSTTIITSGSRKNKKGKNVMGDSAPVKELACSVTDPFNCSACIPDGSTNTGCFSIKQLFTLGTGSTGTACGVYIQPDVDSFSIGDTLSTNATATIPNFWSNASGWSAITSQYQMIRPVSCGISCEYVGNTQTDQGVIVVGQLPSGESVNNLSGNNVGSFTSKLLSYKTFPLRAGCVVTWRPEDMDDMMEFVNCGGSGASTGSATNRPIIVCAIFGATVNTASLVQVEVAANFEGQFKLQTFIPGGISTSKKTTVPAVPGWYERAKNLFNSVEPYLPFVLSMFGGPGSVAAMTMGNGLRYATTLNRSIRGPTG